LAYNTVIIDWVVIYDQFETACFYGISSAK